ncbi:hypothetical protein LUZ60_003476 [Juncus effusus]|nr:hypothetical protein LUZ60_003476 [Juncus effusus]
MRALLLSSSPSLCFSSRLPSTSPFPTVSTRFQSFQFHCSVNPPNTVGVVRTEYKPGLFDDLLLNFFRHKMVQEANWDSEKEGYDGLIEIANQLMKGKTRHETEQSAVRVIKSLFPEWLLVLFKKIFVPIYDGKLASLMVARATAISCKWLMGPCYVNSITLPNGDSSSSGVFVEKCKYLEESKCIGICINTCKLPTQTFFKEYMGVDLYMEPKFEDYSCQFNFGVPPPTLANDKALNEPCLEICTIKNNEKEIRHRKSDTVQCSQF